MLKYYPYKSNKPGKKYYIITESNKKIYFGAAGMSDFTIHMNLFSIDVSTRQRHLNLVLVLLCP